MTLLGLLALAALIWWSVLWLICLLGWSIACASPSAVISLSIVADRSPIHYSKKRYTSQATTSNYDPRNPSRISGDQTPGVSILRPLRGLDANLYENLESSFQQRYPTDKFEIIFSVAEEDDQAIRIVETLRELYPDVQASLLIGEEIVGINPKINNLVRSYRAAKYDMLWVLDSNVLVSPHALGRAIPCFSPSPALKRPIGLVHHVPFPVFPDINLGSRVEQAFLSTTHAKMYLAINRTGIDSCVCGKSTLFRKSDLERATRAHEEKHKGKSEIKDTMKNLPESDRYGIAAFSQYLGEDNMIGRFLWHDAGMRHAIAPDVAANAVGHMKFEGYFWRRVRWIRVRKYMVVASTLLEPLTESIACGLLGGFAFQRFFRIPWWLFFLLHETAWYLLDVSIFRSITLSSPAQTLHIAYHDGPGVSGFKPAFFVAWLTRELFALPVWLFAMMGNKVSWREDGKVYRVRMDGKVEETPMSEGKDWIDKFGENCFRRARGGSRDGERYEAIHLQDEERR